MVTQYIQDNGLQNERRLTHAEVAEDFRIISRTETEEEKSFAEKLFDDFPSFQNEDGSNNNDDEDKDKEN